MDFFTAVANRRSIRRFLPDDVPESVINRALDAAILAPNSSNAQTWNFYWVTTPEKKQKLVEACLSQSAARKAKHLIVITADPGLWRRSHKPLVKWVRDANAPKLVQDYYSKLFPLIYRWGPFNSIALLKWLGSNLAGLFRPMPRGSGSKRSLQEVAIKSAALAAENFVLAVSAQGFDTCMMEGFDECRVYRLLGLRCSERVVMVIAVGKRTPDGTWAQQFRLPRDEVVKVV